MAGMRPITSSVAAMPDERDHQHRRGGDVSLDALREHLDGHLERLPGWTELALFEEKAVVARNVAN